MPGFDAIIDQERPIRILTAFLAKGNIPHALLFTGIEGVGKRTAAIALAMACNCTGEGRDGETQGPRPGYRTEACGQCSACRRIAVGRHPDVLQLAPSGLQIKIDQVRTLCESLAMKPYEARVRLAIIEDAHRMNPAAGNALLKMLEEPPARTVLILTAPQAADLLPTIVSRCQHLRFKPIAQRHLAAILNKAYGFPEKEAGATAAMAYGSVTRALAMHRGQWLLRRAWLMDELEGLPRQPPTVLLALAEKLSQDKPALADVLDLIASWVRDLAVARHAPRAVLHQDMGERILAAGAAVDPRYFHRAARAVDEARRRIQSNANPRLTLEWLLCKLAEGLDTASRPPAP